MVQLCFVSCVRVLSGRLIRSGVMMIKLGQSLQCTTVRAYSSLGPRPSRDSLTKEGLVSNVRFPGCAESACERELCNST